MDNNNRFSIFEAVKNAYIFVGEEWLYLLKAGLLPMAVQIAVELFIQFQRPKEISFIEVYLWELPAIAFSGWFLFLESRLLLLGERLDRLPKDPDYLSDRKQAMKLSVLVTVLFYMGITVAQTLLEVTGELSQSSTNLSLQAGSLMIIGGLVWGVRFGIVPTLAAVRHPIRPVLRQTKGMMFSLRLVVVGLACFLPVTFLLGVITAPFIPDWPDLTTMAKLTEMQQFGLIVADAPSSLIFKALFCASVAYALKQILGSRRKGQII